MKKIVIALVMFGLVGCSSCEDKPSEPEKRSADESGQGASKTAPGVTAGEPGAPAKDPSVVAGERLMAAEQTTLNRAEGAPVGPSVPGFQPVAKQPRFFDIPATGPNMRKKDAGR